MTNFFIPAIPALIGGRASELPFLSPIGELIRLVRLNHLPVARIAHALEIRGNVLSMVKGTRQVIPWDALDAWHLERYGSATQWTGLVPYDGATCETLGKSLRVCLACLRYGYHTAVHQMPWVTVCPWHETALRTRCKCKRPWLYRSVLCPDRPFLTCECGHDPFSRRQALLCLRHFPTARVPALLGKHPGLRTQGKPPVQLIAGTGVSPAMAYAHLLATGSQVYRRRATRTPQEEADLLVMVSQVGNGVGSALVTGQVTQALRRTASRWKRKNAHRGAEWLVINKNGIYIHGDPVLSLWDDDPCHRLMCTYLSPDWVTFIPSAREAFRTVLRNGDVADRTFTASMEALIVIDAVKHLRAVLEGTLHADRLSRPHFRLVMLVKPIPLIGSFIETESCHEHDSATPVKQQGITS